MAKTNKYTSINFNDIFEKKTSTATNKSSSSSSSSSLHKHGGMLVLTRPSPKPLQPQTPKPSIPSTPDHNIQPRSEPTISLRPLGHTGSSSSFASTPKDPPPVSLKPEPFVPPHLRPGFVGKEDKLGQDGQRIERPKSGGGGGYVNRPSNINNNNRPSSAGGGCSEDCWQL